MASAERPFVGRLDAVDALRRRRDSAVAGSGGLTLISGEPGVGKSILLARLASEAKEKGMRVLVGRAPPLENPPPFVLLRSALESALVPSDPSSDPDSAPTLAFAARGAEDRPLLGFAPRTDLGRGPDPHAIEERLLEQLGEPAGPTPLDRGRGPGAPAARLLEIADSGPTLLVLDDLHLADDPSLEAIVELAPQLDRHALWIVGSTLPVGSLPELRRGTLEQIAQVPGAETISLRGLTALEVPEFLRALAPGRVIPEEEMTRWHSRSGGNPSFLEEILRTSGAPIRLGEAAAIDDGSADFATIARRQLEQLPDPERRTLGVAAVLGREFSFELLQRATGEDEERLSETIQTLVNRGLLRETSDERIEFPRDDLRAELDATLTDAHRRVLHRLAAEGLEALGTADEATVYALARHYYLGRVDEKALEFNRLAGDFATRAFAPGVARVHYERAIECARRLGSGTLAELELTLDLALQLDRLGELVPAERLLRAAIVEFGERPEIPEAHQTLLTIYLARILGDQGRWGEADALTAALLEDGRPSGSPTGQLAVHRLRGEMLYFQGRYDDSLKQHDAALELARAMRNDREVARETVRRANVLGMIAGRLDEAIEAYHLGSRSLISLGDQAEASYALLYLGVVLAQHGRLAESLTQLRAAAELAEEAREPRRLGWALFNAADVEREMGEITRARTANHRAWELLGHVGDRLGLLQTYIVEGKIRLAEGDLPGAEMELLEAYRLVRDLKSTPDELEVVLRLAELADRRGDRAMALTRLEELARREVEQLRPDLAPDYRKLKMRLEPTDYRKRDVP